MTNKQTSKREVETIYCIRNIKPMKIKRILNIVALLAISLALNAQSKKVAVMETKNIQGVSAFQGNIVRGGMETAVANAPGYEGYDRAAFDVIMKEQKFQRSGAVDDKQIREMGIMAGVQYVLVTEASTEDGYFYILAKLLDVETGRFMKSEEQLCEANPKDIKEACSKLGVQLFGGSGSGSSGSGTNNSQSPRHQDFTETAFGLNMRMIYVEGGTFTMGCTSEQGGDCDSDESPNRRTTVNSFYMGMLEVTQSQWEKVMGTSVYQQRNKANPEWPMEGTGPDYPMYYVSWEEAKEFCARLSRQTGKTYRLPTEAEWEYAARGGKKAEGTKYSGSNYLGSVAWYTDNSSSSTHPCGTKQANALGIYDMSGNVLEWCEDWYGNYLSYDTNNPKGASSGQYRVLRGGSWYNSASYCRVASRDYNTPDNRGGDGGFRVVLVP